MDLILKSPIKLYDEYSGLAIDILEEFNRIVEILCDDEIKFLAAKQYLESLNLSYFSLLSLNNKIWVKQIYNKGIDSKEFLLMKKYDNEDLDIRISKFKDKWNKKTS